MLKRIYPTFIYCLLIVSTCLIGLSSLSAQTVPYTIGRIVVSSDGNMHDDDDWGASAATLAIIASQDLQSKLVLYVYNDHVWWSENDDEAEMELSVVQTAAKFGFWGTNLVSAVDDPDAAYNALRDAILASTASDPLTIIAGGPMQVTGSALALAKAVDASALQHVRVISHSTWNNDHSDKPITNANKSDYESTHSGWTWAEMETEFAGNGVVFDQIDDQNDYTSQTVGFATTNADGSNGKYWDAWYFMRDYSAHSADVNSAIQYCYSRLEAVRRPDLSDSGMAYYLFTGDDQGGPAGLETMLDNGFLVPPAMPVSYAATSDFPVINVGEVPFTKEGGRSALMINASTVANRDKYARATTTFTGVAGQYQPSLTTLKETDGESSYRLWIDGVLQGTVTNDTTSTDYEPQVHTFPAVTLSGSESIWVEAIAVTNGNIPEGSGAAYARGRWTELSFVPFADGIFSVTAGDDRTLALPVTSVILEGTVSGDYDSLQWSQISGPNTATLSGATTATLLASGLVNGSSYVFELRASNSSSGRSKADLVSVRVKSPADVWEESGGMVIMEMENTVSAYDLWEEKTTYQTHTGGSYLEFTGNSPVTGSAKSPLEYEFTIHTAGLYYLHLHCAKLNQNVDDEWRSDVANDCFVKVNGDYTASPDAGDNHNDDAKLSLLTKDLKFYGGSQKKFGWFPGSGLGGHLDPGGHNNKRVAVYNFKAGETYTLTMSGRSRDFAVNRILFRHVDTAFATATNLSTPESSKAVVGVLVSAGEDQLVELPTDSLTLDGAISSPSTLTSIEWTQTSGPSVTMAGVDTEDLQLSNLVAGVYEFTLSGENVDGDDASDTATVIVKPEPRGEVFYVDFATNTATTGGDRGIGVPDAVYPTYNSISRTEMGDDATHTKALVTVDGESSGVSLTATSTRGGDAFRPKGIIAAHTEGHALGIDEKAYGDCFTIYNDDFQADVRWEFSFSGLTGAAYNVILLAATVDGDETTTWSVTSGAGGSSDTPIDVVGGDYSTVVRWTNVSPESGEIAFQGLSVNPAPGTSKWNLGSRVMFLALEIVPDGGFERFEAVNQLSGGESGDDDGDGFSNLREYAMGGDPKDAGHTGLHPKVMFDVHGAPYLSTVELTDALRGVDYTVQMRTDLTSGEWRTLPNNGRPKQPINGTSELEEVQHMLPSGDDYEGQIFLRVLID